MVSSAIKLVTIGAVGVGGIGTALWTAGIFSDPYESKWYGKIEGLSDSELVCGKIRNKYDCKLSLPLALVGIGGGGAETKIIKVTNIDEISKGDIARSLYLYDKDKSVLWYIFSNSKGSLGESWKVTTKNLGTDTKPVVQLCRKDSSGCVSSQPQCCGSSFTGQKVDKEFEKKWQAYSKKVSARNIWWKLSYL